MSAEFPVGSRSSRREVRNPVLGLPAAAQLKSLPPEALDALDGILRDLAADAQWRAQHSWLKSKAPQAAYWKAVSTYAKHIRRVVRISRSKPTHL